MQIYIKSWKTDGQMTLLSATGPKKCKKAIPVYIRSNGIEKMQIQILICYTKWNQCLNSNDTESSLDRDAYNCFTNCLTQLNIRELGDHNYELCHAKTGRTIDYHSYHRLKISLQCAKGPGQVHNTAAWSISCKLFKKEH